MYMEFWRPVCLDPLLARSAKAWEVCTLRASFTAQDQSFLNTHLHWLQCLQVPLPGCWGLPLPVRTDRDRGQKRSDQWVRFANLYLSRFPTDGFPSVFILCAAFATMAFVLASVFVYHAAGAAVLPSVFVSQCMVAAISTVSVFAACVVCPVLFVCVWFRLQQARTNHATNQRMVSAVLAWLNSWEIAKGRLCCIRVAPAWLLSNDRNPSSRSGVWLDPLALAPPQRRGWHVRMLHWNTDAWHWLLMSDCCFSVCICSFWYVCVSEAEAAESAQEYAFGCRLLTLWSHACGSIFEALCCASFCSHQWTVEKRRQSSQFP